MNQCLKAESMKKECECRDILEAAHDLCDWPRGKSITCGSAMCRVIRSFYEKPPKKGNMIDEYQRRRCLCPTVAILFVNINPC